jgi:hypothetical protein
MMVARDSSYQAVRGMIDYSSILEVPTHESSKGGQGFANLGMIHGIFVRCFLLNLFVSFNFHLILFRLLDMVIVKTM